MKRLAAFFVFFYFFVAQSQTFYRNVGQVYDQEGQANSKVQFLSWGTSFHTVLHDEGFSYETFDQIDSLNTQITRIDFALSLQDKFLENWHWEASLPKKERINIYNALGVFQNIPNFEKVEGIPTNSKDVKLIFFYSEEGELKYNLLVKEKRLAKLKLHVPPEYALEKNSSSSFSYTYNNTTFQDSIPLVYRLNQPNEALDYSVHIENKTMSFRLGKSENQSNNDWIVIDPIPRIKWATYYGASGSDVGFATSHNLEGNAIFVGRTTSTSQIASTGAYQNSLSGNTDDGFIAKMYKDPITNQRMWATYFGGTGKDQFNDVQIDLSGNLITTGLTQSNNLAKNARYDNSYNQKNDAFVAKFKDSTGSLVWFNYIGGSEDDEGLGITSDSAENILVVGKTNSNGLSSRLNSNYTIHDNTKNNQDGFLAKFDSSGQRYFITYFGGTASDYANSVTSGLEDTIFICGTTRSSNGISNSNSARGDDDIFIARFTEKGALSRSCYFGDTLSDKSSSINFFPPFVYMVGTTNSQKKIAQNGHQNTLNLGTNTQSSNTDALLVKFDHTLNVQWATYYGGDNPDDGSGVVVDDYGYIYMIGSTESENDNLSGTISNIIATDGAVQEDLDGGADVYLVKFTPKGKRVWGTYFGKTANDYGYGLSHGKYGDVYLTGETRSQRRLIVKPWQTNYGGSGDAFFADLYYCENKGMLKSDTVCLNDTFTILYTDSTIYLDTAISNKWKQNWDQSLFQWYGPKDTTKIISTKSSFRHIATWADTGYYKLIVRDSFGCADTIRILINYFYDLPKDTFQGDTLICSWDSLSLVSSGGVNIKNVEWWTIDSSFYINGTNDTTISDANKAKYEGLFIRKITNGKQCSFLDTFRVRIGPFVDISSNSPVCPKDTIRLYATGEKIKTIRWFGPNNFSDSTLNPKILDANDNKKGTYSAIIEDSLGCVDTFHTTVDLFNLDSLNLTFDNINCSNDALEIKSSYLSNINRYQFQWIGPDSIYFTGYTFSLSNIPRNWSGYKDFYLKITDTLNNCAQDTTFAVPFYLSPKSVITSNLPICEGDSLILVLNPSGGSGIGYAFNWVAPIPKTYTNDTLLIANTTRADSGLYYVNVTDSRGCDHDTSILVDMNMRPDVDFGINDTNQCLLGNLFQFSDSSAITSDSLKSWLWEVESPDSFRNTKNTHYSYKKPGTYRVTLKVTSSEGCSDTLGKLVTVNPMPEAKIWLPDSSLCQGINFPFVDSSKISSGTITNHKWILENGDSSLQRNPSFIFQDSGVYQISLVVQSDQGCLDTTRQKITITKPLGDLSGNTAVCEGDTLLLKAKFTTGWSGVNHIYTWTRPNASNAVSDSILIPSATRSDSGYYSLKITDSRGCVLDTGILVDMNMKPDVDFGINDTNQCLLGNLFQFSDSSAITSDSLKSWLWEVESPDSFRNTKNTQYSYKKSGTYRVTLKVTSTEGCSDTLGKLVTVNPMPEAKIWIQDSSQCVGATFYFRDSSSISTGNIVSRKWFFGNGDSSTLNDPTTTYDSSGNFEIKLITTSAEGCTDTITDSVLVYPLPIPAFVINKDSQCISPNQLFILRNTSSTVGNSSIATYLWNLGNGRTSNRSDTVHVAYANHGNFPVSLETTTSDGCVSSTLDTLTVHPLPIINFTINDTGQCLRGNRFTFRDSSYVSYGTINNWKWNFGDDSSTTRKSKKESFTYSDARRYIVRLKAFSNYGCFDSLSKSVTVYPMPLAGFKILTADTQCVKGNQFSWVDTSKISSGTYQKYWFFGDNDSSSFVDTAIHRYKSYGQYTVNLIAESNFGCLDTSAQNVVANPFIKGMSIVSNDPICSQDTLRMLATGTVSRLWVGPKLSSINSNQRWPNGFSDTALNVIVPNVSLSFDDTMTLIGVDTFGCIDTVKKRINIIDCLRIELSQDSVKCHGTNTGKAWVKATGGSGSYFYYWNTSPARYSDTIQNVATGWYTVTVRDPISNASVTDSVFVYGRSPIRTTLSVDSLLCRDSATANIYSFVTGGTRPYRYQWNGQQKFNKSTLQNVSSGTHQLIVTDKYNCKDTAIAIITNPPKWDFTFARKAIRCYDGSDGEVSVSVSGGLSPYFYEWDSVTWNSPSKVYGNTYKNLAAGIYKVRITDDQKCQQEDTVILTQPDSLEIFRTRIQNLSCFGDANGVIEIEVKGGKGPYSYLWNTAPKETTRIINNLRARKYAVVVEDGNNCLLLDTFEIVQPPKNPLLVDPLFSFCMGDSILLSAFMDRAINYRWYFNSNTLVSTQNNFFRNSSIKADAGIYSVVAVDNNGCSDSGSTQVRILDLPNITAEFLPSNFCKGDAVVLNANGGVSFQWTGPNNFSSNLKSPQIDRFSKAYSGTYYVIGTNAAGCKASDSVSAAVPYNINILGDTLLCEGENLRLFSIGAKYSEWSGPNGFVSQSQSPLISNVDLSNAGSYLLYGEDFEGCKDTLAATVRIFGKPQFKPISISPICLGEPLQFYSQGSVDFSYQWTGPAGFSSTQKDPLINPTTSLNQAGTYYAKASYQPIPGKTCTDSMGTFVKIFPIPIADFDIIPNAQPFINNRLYKIEDKGGSNASKQYFLNGLSLGFGNSVDLIFQDSGFNTVKQLVRSFDTSFYSLQVCKDSLEKNYRIFLEPKIYLPNAFSPNADGKNDTYKPIILNVKSYRMRIFDRWGLKVYDGEDGFWDGNFSNGRPCVMDAYLGICDYVDIDGKTGTIKEIFVLLR